MGESEKPLVGGAQTVGLVRVGGTVRRPRSAGSDRAQALLRHLEMVGFPGAPRALGYDELGREVVTFVEGNVPHVPPYGLSDAQLVSGTELIRAFHDATTGSGLRGSQDVVCHGDLGPHNMVFRGDTAVAIIDWDAGLGPGRRAVDVAHAVWCFADLIESGVPVEEQARRCALMCDAYPGMTPSVVVQELETRFRRARARHGLARRHRAVQVFDRLLAWSAINGGRLAP